MGLEKIISESSVLETEDYKLIKNSVYMDSEWYRKEYQIPVGKDCIEHYMDTGWKQGNDPSSKFSTVMYQAIYPDARKSEMNPLIHFLQYGQKENRKIRELKMGWSEDNQFGDPILQIKNHNNPLPGIMISVYAFSYGGGEIMPIRLANKLHQLGYPVVVHSLDKNRNLYVQEVRDMLEDDIIVLEENLIHNMAFYFSLFKTGIVNTHHIACQMFFGELVDEYSILKKEIRHIATMHGMYETCKKEDFCYIWQKINLHISEWTYVADKNTIAFIQNGFFDESHFHKIGNGMDVPEIHAVDRKQFCMTEDTFVFSIISRGLREKGWREAISIVTKLREKTGKDLRLLIIGAGEEYDRLVDSETINKQAFIYLLGYQNRPFDYLAITDMLLFPTFYESESAPLTIIEAILSGVPVAATDIGEVRNMITVDNQTAGVLFELDHGRVSVEKAVEKLLPLIDNDGRVEELRELTFKKSKEYQMFGIAQKYLNCFFRKDRLMEEAEDPLVSVIVPIYNYDQFLHQRLESIYHQTYQKIDVLLLDDASNDDSKKIMEEYREQYPEKTRCFYNDKNSGSVFKQWEKGIKEAKGELCWIAESDDWCALDFLEKQVGAFQDQQVILSYCKSRFVTEQGLECSDTCEDYLASISKEKWSHSYQRNGIDEIKEVLAYKNVIPNVSAVLMQKKPALEVLDKIQDISLKLCKDWLFYAELLKRGKVSYTVNTINNFRMHSQKVTGQVIATGTYLQERIWMLNYFAKQYPLNFWRVKILCKELLQESRISDEYLLKRAKRTLYKNVIMGVVKDNWKLSLAPVRPEASQQAEIILLSTIDTQKTRNTFENKMEGVGYNTGNMVFSHALQDQLNPVLWEKEEFGPNRVGIKARGVLPCANFIFPGSNKVAINNLIKLYRCPFPVTPIGLGAQAELKQTAEEVVASLKPHTVAMLKMMSRKTATIGVRGTFTAQCLEQLNINNYKVIGCPSFYSKHMEENLHNMKEPNLSKVLINSSLNDSMGRELLELGKKVNAEWIIQQPEEIEGIKTNIFFDMEEWNHYLDNEKFTFAIGTRFHGNMVALQKGIPTLWIVHDKRTEELVKALQLPHIYQEQMAEIDSLQDLFSFCNYTKLSKVYPQLESFYESFLKENHLIE
ncbi:MAG: glycosyltransferase [Lachnospiraceae bacterium]|nr:glycosyltransferase [Lachnospiraceae bacterium]